MRDEYIYRGTCSLIKFESIEESFKRCINNPIYRVVIYVTSADRRRNIVTYIKNHFNQYIESYGLKIFYSTAPSIYFPNGSMISIVKADDSSRGYKAHYSLIEENLSDDAIGRFVLTQSIPYRYKPSLNEALIPEKDVVAQQLLYEQNDGFINNNFFDVEENNELDEFINSFKINKNT